MTHSAKLGADGLKRAHYPVHLGSPGVGHDEDPHQAAT